MDIKGFTTITEELMEKGKDGAETLSILLEAIFSPVTRLIYEYEGFITGFAGDSISAVFPVDRCQVWHALGCVQKIKNFVSKSENDNPEEKNISLKIGVSLGSVEWGTIGHKRIKTFFFRGEAVDRSVAAEKKCRDTEIVLDSSLFKFLENIRVKTTMLDDTHLVMESIEIPETDPKKGEVEIFDLTKLKEIYDGFVSEDLSEMPYKGEFREITAVFVQFQGKKEFEDLKIFVEKIFVEIEKFGGYFSSLDFGDKGDNFLVVFGAPRSLSNNQMRAVEFALAIRRETIKAGINTGIVYAGMIGDELRCNYSFLGEAVIIASRLMQKAGWGELVSSDRVEEELSGDFDFEFLGELKLKGKAKMTSAYKITGESKKTGKESALNKIFGRENERKALAIGIEEVRQFRFGGLFHIYGEAGSGKTFFVLKAFEGYETRVNLLSFSCDPILKESLNPVVGFLKSYFRQRTCESEAEKKTNFEIVFNNLLQTQSVKREKILVENPGEKLLKIKPFLQELLNIDHESNFLFHLEQKQKKEITMFSLKDFFLCLCSIKPTVFFMDDFQWIDDETLEFTEIFLRGIEDYPVCFITASRMDEENLPLKKKIKGKEIEMRPLDYGNAVEMMGDILKKEISEEASSFIYGKTQGNPFYVYQFCKFLFDNNLFIEKYGIYDIQAEKIEVPDTVFSLLVARFDQFPLNLRLCLQTASVLGNDFDVACLFEILKQSQNMEKKNFDEALGSLVKEGCLFFTEASICSFKSNFLREAIYQMQLKSILKQTHLLAAQSIEKSHGDHTEFFYQIARHYYLSENFEKALPYYRKAADFLMKKYRNREAVESLERIIEISKDQKEKFTCFYKRMKTNFYAGNWEKAISDALYLCESLKNVIEVEYYIQTLNILGQLYLYTGKADKALETSQLGVSICESMGAEDQKWIFWGLLGQIYNKKGEYDVAMKYYEDERTAAERQKDNDTLTKVLGNMGLIHWVRGEFDRAIELYLKQKEIYEIKGDYSGLSFVLLNLGSVYFHQNRLDESMEHFEQSLYYSEKTGYKRLISASFGNLGGVYYEKGDLKKAFECFNRKKKISIELGDRQGIGLATGNIGSIHAEKGDYQKAMENFQEKKKICQEIGDMKGLVHALESQGELYIKTKRTQEALNCITQAEEICDRIGYKIGKIQAKFYMGKVLLMEGKYMKALDEFRNVIALEKQIGTQVFSAYTKVGVCISKIEDKDNNIIKELSTLTGFSSDPLDYFNYSLEKLSIKANSTEYADALSDYGDYLLSISKKGEGDKQKMIAKEIYRGIRNWK
ncbi:tetratricopeptide repeat protein [candidate division WOR-3 bacterium]|nr:tetratricopeptide repeat protein [candidate division WOR-3 bacterium]